MECVGKNIRGYDGYLPASDEVLLQNIVT